MDHPFLDEKSKSDQSSSVPSTPTKAKMEE
jgi:hypothetical protein